MPRYRLSYAHKLDRAYYHLQTLKSEIETWLARKPYSISDQLDANRGFNVVTLTRDNVVPFRISPILGDCIQNLRSALDHLVFDLAETHQAGALSDALVRRTEFPIFHERLKFEREGTRKIRHIDPGAQAEIERLQPYRAGDRYKGDLLWLLNELSIIDKHRALIGVIGIPSLKLPQNMFRPEFVQPLRIGPKARQAEVLYYRLRKDEPAVNMQFDSSVQVIFGDGPAVGREIVGLLGIINGYVREEGYFASSLVSSVS